MNTTLLNLRQGPAGLLGQWCLMPPFRNNHSSFCICSARLRVCAPLRPPACHPAHHLPTAKHSTLPLGHGKRPRASMARSTRPKPRHSTAGSHGHAWGRYGRAGDICCPRQLTPNSVVRVTVKTVTREARSGVCMRNAANGSRLLGAPPHALACKRANQRFSTLEDASPSPSGQWLTIAVNVRRTPRTGCCSSP